MTQLDRDVRPDEVYVVRKGDLIGWRANVDGVRCKLVAAGRSRRVAETHIGRFDEEHPEQLHAVGPLPLAYIVEKEQPVFAQGFGVYSQKPTSLKVIK